MHSKTTGNFDENGGYSKAELFLVWIGEKRASFEIGNGKKRHILSFPSEFSGEF